MKLKFSVNISKTKIVVFGSGTDKNTKPPFKYGNSQLETVDSYVYLGIKFLEYRIHTVKIYGAKRAYFCLLKQRLELSYSIVDDFTYSPVWVWNMGAGYSWIIERESAIKFKLASERKSSTPNFIVYGKLGFVCL